MAAIIGLVVTRDQQHFNAKVAARISSLYCQPLLTVQSEEGLQHDALEFIIDKKNVHIAKYDN